MNLDIQLQQGPTLSQQLNLAPQLLNWLKLLQCPTTELSSMVAHELETNPALEAEHPVSDNLPTPEAEREWENGLESPADRLTDEELDAKMTFLSELEHEWSYDVRRSGYAGASSSEEHEKRQFIMDSIVGETSLTEHLLKQLSTLKLDNKDYPHAEFIIGSLDHRGYLETPLEELAQITGTPLADFERTLQQVQWLDPAGVAARDLRECLHLQLEALGEEQSLAGRIVMEELESLAKFEYQAIAERLNASATEVQAAVAFIMTLNPAPGAGFSARPVEYVTPDVIVRRVEDEFVVTLNDDYIPRLRISASCRNLLERGELSADDRSYIRNKLRTATFLIQGVSQRQETLQKVAREIIRVQSDFLSRDNGTLRPLTMAKVASVIGVHETTVSRALAGKFIQTPRGVFEMKYFFRSGYLCRDGSAMTPESVKGVIKELIEAEDPLYPLTDLDVVETLKEKGLHLARRTIAKYRDELGIPASKERKKAAATPSPTASPRSRRVPSFKKRTFALPLGHPSSQLAVAG